MGRIRNRCWCALRVLLRNFVRRSLLIGFLCILPLQLAWPNGLAILLMSLMEFLKMGLLWKRLSDSFLNMLVLFATNIVGSMGLLANVLCRATLPDHNYTHAHHFEITKGLNLATKNLSR